MKLKIIVSDKFYIVFTSFSSESLMYSGLSILREFTERLTNIRYFSLIFVLNIALPLFSSKKYEFLLNGDGGGWGFLRGKRPLYEVAVYEHENIENIIVFVFMRNFKIMVATLGHFEEIISFVHRQLDKFEWIFQKWFRVQFEPFGKIFFYFL